MADGGHGFPGVRGGGAIWSGLIEGFDLRQEGGFAGIIEAKEEYGVFYYRDISARGWDYDKDIDSPSLLVAYIYRDLAR